MLHCSYSVRPFPCQKWCTVSFITSIVWTWNFNLLIWIAACNVLNLADTIWHWDAKSLRSSSPQRSKVIDLNWSISPWASCARGDRKSQRRQGGEGKPCFKTWFIFPKVQARSINHCRSFFNVRTVGENSKSENIFCCAQKTPGCNGRGWPMRLRTGLWKTTSCQCVGLNAHLIWRWHHLQS